MSESEPFRRRIVAEARKWIGTPYLHQASLIGVGCDCLGLVRGIWRELLGEEPEETPNYSADWGEVSGTESMLTAANRWFRPISTSEVSQGDLLLFRWKNAAVVHHAGIASEDDRFIHAYEKAGVVETNLGSQWRTRIAAAFKFPQTNPVEK